MKRILFHGTSNDIKEFNELSIGVGQDPNSALGIHTTDSPIYSAEYAERSKTLNNNLGEPVVLVIEYESNCCETINNYEDFYGDDDEGTNTKEYFSNLRKDLIEDCFDLVHFEGDEESITTLLIPERIKIINKISVKEAIKLYKYMEKEKITWDMTDKILKSIDFIKK